MGLVEELEARTASRFPGTPCSVKRALASVPDKDRPDIVAAIDRRDTITATVICDYLRDRYGVALGDQSLRKHRQGKCRCRLSTS